MADIIRFVEDLIEKGFAYESQGDVYFRGKSQLCQITLVLQQNLDEEFGRSVYQ